MDEQFGKFVEVIQKLYINILLLDAIQVATYAKYLRDILKEISSTIKDQLSYNKKIESKLAQLVAALPFATNLERVNAITTRGGKSTCDPPYRTRTGKTPAAV